MGHTVGRADDKIIEGELGIEIHTGGMLTLCLVGLVFLLHEHLELGIGLEHLLQRILHIFGAAANDHILTEFIGCADHQIFIGKLHDLCIIQPGRDHCGGNFFF